MEAALTLLDSQVPNGYESASQPFRRPGWGFVVYGDARPAGSKRAFKHPHTGKIVVTEMAKGAKPWRADVQAAALEVFRGPLLTGPLAVTFTIYRPRPAGHLGTGRNAGTVKDSAPAYPTTRPDVLKLARALEDALQGIVYRDDSQIVDEFLHKRYGEPARAEVSITPL